MKNINITFFLTLIGLYLIFSLPCSAGNSLENQKTLKGITELGVIVENVSENLQNKGVSTNNLRAMVIRLLKEKNIKVDSLEKISGTPGSPVLDLYIQDNYSPKDDVFIFTVDLVLFQDAILDRDKSLGKFGLESWSVSYSGTTTSEKIELKINSIVDNFVNRFINAYWAVN